ncbi:hypothetical protein BU25DRAFT_411214 [Macroventuria anomochaeta]|uniref:Uncharacterized protein n=1 Tax=Macroventuria anomochaeta TaxID=301207 RepID=A0ACB6RZD9_9PLEO|nr:uncharacterized protein BU25DRAFT_411214 [Macroventuria anomochaeta]KAF2627138.1 hypothetical protein BU25DRAFT_411214 [Macroventuria anomochaeta]
MTQDNPYTDLPSGATAFDGPKHTRALRDLKVGLMNIRPRDEVGYIALKSVEDDEVRLRSQMIQKGRLFDLISRAKTGLMA